MSLNARITGIFGAIAIVFALIFGLASPASAAAYTRSVYSPARNGNTLIAWADLSRDCSGTYGCWNYMKITRDRLWGQEFVAGSWVNNNGWNSISAGLPGGCFNYRTTVDSYNDTLISSGVGINVGPVGANSSNQTIYRFKRTWSSGTTRYCR